MSLKNPRMRWAQKKHNCRRCGDPVDIGEQHFGVGKYSHCLNCERRVQSTRKLIDSVPVLIKRRKDKFKFMLEAAMYFYMRGQTKITCEMIQSYCIQLRPDLVWERRSIGINLARGKSVAGLEYISTEIGRKRAQYWTFVDESPLLNLLSNELKS